ncbi:MAG: PilZ domain-containing protein [Candidatus Omnitrophica bacterium]|nr:PilZ domain-containing protein [Candidatus Omnitrophota bacterium]
MVYQGPERRRFERVAVELTITYHVHKPISIRMMVGNTQVGAKTFDLSEGGMAITTSRDIPISSILLMKFTLVDKTQTPHAMSITGQVRYNILIKHEEHRLGIDFTQIKKEDKTIIADFVKTALNDKKTS